MDHSNVYFMFDFRHLLLLFSKTYAGHDLVPFQPECHVCCRKVSVCRFLVYDFVVAHHQESVSSKWSEKCQVSQKEKEENGCWTQTLMVLYVRLRESLFRRPTSPLVNCDCDGVQREWPSRSCWWRRPGAGTGSGSAGPSSRPGARCSRRESWAGGGGSPSSGSMSPWLPPGEARPRSR
ncbi:hypothetical protein CEXT_506291 [Caerostris extrusa]|uniref:Uncharacterized protein n=1 Tax=Caerostris extrusa TaxID=172846 RepID=A0AAV4W1P6_CAEEX|nr:hypothetical protein CEXT_506291 [Caerostris extrusa]